MTNPQQNGKPLEEQLVEFTDRMLNNTLHEQDEATYAPDPELHALESTVQRLNAAFGGFEPDETVIQNMRNNIIEKWRNRESTISNRIWKKWIRRINLPKQKWVSQQSRKRSSIVASLATLVIILMLAIPFMNSTDSGLPGASGQAPSTYVLIALGGLILLILWHFRRRP
jgi:nitric oxide reductase large subunit